MITESNFDHDDFSASEQIFAYAILSGILADLAGIKDDNWLAVLDGLSTIHTGYPNGVVLCIFIFSVKVGIGSGDDDKELVVQLNNNNTVLFLGTSGGPRQFEFELVDPNSLPNFYNMVRKCLDNGIYFSHRPIFHNPII
jgi:hypothetical protein